MMEMVSEVTLKTLRSFWANLGSFWGHFEFIWSQFANWNSKLLQTSYVTTKKK